MECDNESAQQLSSWSPCSSIVLLLAWAGHGSLSPSFMCQMSPSLNSSTSLHLPPVGSSVWWHRQRFLCWGQLGHDELLKSKLNGCKFRPHTEHCCLETCNFVYSMYSCTGTLCTAVQVFFPRWPGNLKHPNQCVNMSTWRWLHILEKDNSETKHSLFRALVSVISCVDTQNFWHFTHHIWRRCVNLRIDNDIFFTWRTQLRILCHWYNEARLVA